MPNCLAPLPLCVLLCVLLCVNAATLPRFIYFCSLNMEERSTLRGLGAHYTFTE